MQTITPTPHSPFLYNHYPYSIGTFTTIAIWVDAIPETQFETAKQTLAWSIFDPIKNKWSQKKSTQRFDAVTVKIELDEEKLGFIRVAGELSNEPGYLYNITPPFNITNIPDINPPAVAHAQKKNQPNPYKDSTQTFGRPRKDPSTLSLAYAAQIKKLSDKIAEKENILSPAKEWQARNPSQAHEESSLESNWTYHVVPCATLDEARHSFVMKANMRRVFDRNREAFLKGCGNTESSFEERNEWLILLNQIVTLERYFTKQLGFTNLDEAEQFAVITINAHYASIKSEREPLLTTNIEERLATTIGAIQRTRTAEYEFHS
jgi:hypothetical protein